MTRENVKNLYDVVVIGGGPAGLTAALYLARACYRVLVIEKEKFGGQITITSEVVNYPGIMETDGTTLTETMRKQAENFGAEFLLAEVQSLDFSQDIRVVKTSRGDISCFGILLATGAHPRMAGFRGEEEFRGHGVAYCATCDGSFFTGKEVFVIGGGFAAAEEAVFLTKYASHVTILIRGDDFKCAKATADLARNHEKITVLTNTEVLEVSGDQVLKVLRYRNKITGEVSEYRAAENDTFGVFVFAGYAPATELIKDIAEVNDRGYILTNRRQKTNVDGLYAAGDVCDKELRQVVTAVGDGAQAATELERYAASMQKKTGLKPEVVQKEIKKENKATQSNDLLSEEMKSQLQTVFGRMQKPLVLRLLLNEKTISNELKQYMEALVSETEKLRVEVVDESSFGDTSELHLPCVQVCYQDGNWSGLSFHGVPGGHEFTSFVLGLYNAAGPGQPMDEASKQAIQAIQHPINLKIIVSLSCTMCPELVMAAQRIAGENPYVSAEVYDVQHFPDLKEKYNVMSVPCMVINDQQVIFGKKNIQQLLELIS